MMNRISKWPFFLLLLILLGSFGSCVTKKQIARAKEEYLIFRKGLDSVNSIPPAPETRLRAYSDIDVTVITGSLQKAQLDMFGDGKPMLFKLDSFGRIYFPVLGKIDLLNLTRNEAAQKIQKQLQPILKEPYVKLNFGGFFVTVTGEVTKPGVFKVNEDNPTLLQALSMSGYDNILSRRDSILIMRQNGADLEKKYVDLRDARTVFNPDVYYLHPNDLIMVGPTERAIKVYINSGKQQDLVSLQKYNIILGMTFFLLPILSFIMSLSN